MSSSLSSSSTPAAEVPATTSQHQRKPFEVMLQCPCYRHHHRHQQQQQHCVLLCRCSQCGDVVRITTYSYDVMVCGTMAPALSRRCCTLTSGLSLANCAYVFVCACICPAGNPTTLPAGKATAAEGAALPSPTLVRDLSVFHPLRRSGNLLLLPSRPEETCHGG